MSNNVRVIGAGIHPFGRHDGKTGLDMGVFAIREALADAGVDWKDVQFAFGGSAASGDADAVLPRLGLTGVQFINVANGCATGGSALLAGSCLLAAFHSRLPAIANTAMPTRMPISSGRLP